MVDFITDTQIAAELRRLKDELLGIRCRIALISTDATRVAVALSVLAAQIEPSEGGAADGNAAIVQPRLPNV